MALLRLVLVGAALLSSAAAAFGCLWIVLPAPDARFAWWAILAGEGSLWLGGLALLGVALALGALATGIGWPAWVVLALGTLALGVALVPPLQAAAVAQSHGATLGVRPDLFGWRDGPSGPPPQTLTFATVAGRSLALDLYRPPPGAGPAPAVVVIHGGGWTGGDKGELSQWSVWLAQQGFAVFDVEYRLAPPPTWRAAPGDVKCAIGWVKRHATDYDVDPDRVALLGRSAGAHLALLAAYTPGQDALPPSCDAGDTTVRAVVELYGPTDLAWGYDHPSNPRVYDGPAAVRALLGDDPQTVPDRYAVASPTAHVGPGTPPTLLVHGGRDQYVSPQHVALLAERLEAISIPHRTVVLPYAQHAFDYIWNGWGAQVLRPVLLDFLRTYTR